MTRSAPRSIDQYLKALREELAGEDAALIQDALYDAEEYLRAEVAAHPDKSESDVLELIASTYGAPDEVASAYRDTEAKVKAAMTTPRKIPEIKRVIRDLQVAEAERVAEHALTLETAHQVESYLRDQLRRYILPSEAVD